MQRHRINYHLLFGLAAVTVVVGGLAFFVVHPWQVNRNAEWFRERAETAIEEGDLRTALDYQSKYVRYRTDEDDARIKLANLAVDVSKLTDATPRERGHAYDILKSAVVRTSDSELRRKYVDMLIAGGRPNDAIPHIDELLANDPGNSELLALRVRSLFGTKDFRKARELAYRLIGYDKKSKTFDPEKATAADQPEIYSLLATTLFEIDKKRELARQIIDQMVEVNPESYEAHLKQSFFLQSIGEKEEAQAALALAYQLNPTDAAVLKRMGQVALIDKDYEKAQQYLSEGLESNPQDIRFFQLLALVEMQQGNTEEAIEILDRGIKEFGAQRAIELILYKINTLFQANDFAKVGDELKSLEKLKLPALEPLIAFQRARIKWHDKQWATSARELKRLRPLLFRFSDAQALAGIMLGSAYENLGQNDLGKQAYQTVLRDRPNDPRALLGIRRIDQKFGQKAPEGSRGFDLLGLAREMLAQPETQQDWKKIDELISGYVEKNDLPETTALLSRAQIFFLRKMFPEARAAITQASEIDPENLAIRLAAVKLLWLEPDSGPQKALLTLDKVEEKHGVSPQTLSLRAGLLVAIGDEKISQQLHSLVDKTVDWEDGPKMQLYVLLGTKFLQLGQLEDSLHFWNQAAKLAPNNLPVRMQLFNVAFQKQDDEAMRDAQQKILELLPDKNDATYILTEAKRQIVAYGKNQITKEELLGVRKLLDKAMQQRPEWHELHIVYGQLLLVLKQDLNLALERLNDALKYGPPNMKTISLQVQLLAGQGLFQEARKKMELIPVAARSQLLRGAEAEVLMATGDTEKAFDAAQIFADRQPESLATQQWFAKIATKTGRLKAAEGALRKTIELNPADADSWSQLMILVARQKEAEKLQETLRAALLVLDAEYIPLLTAKSYELRGRWKNAEVLYLAAYGQRPDDLSLAKRLAEFYLLWKSADSANEAKASVYLNRILRASYEGEVSLRDKPTVDWARQQAALILSASGDYQRRQQAMQILMQGATEGKLSVKNQALKGKILAALKDPVSQAQAIQVLSDLRKKGQLNTSGMLILAQLIHSAGDWQRSEDVVLDALAASPDDPAIRQTYISLLMEHGKFDIAQSSLNRLKNSPSLRGVYLQLLARLSAKKGDSTAVRKALVALLPGNIKDKLEPTQLALVRSVAQMATGFGDIEMAEKLYTIYVQQVPTAAFEYVRFEALHGDAEKAITMMQKMMPQKADSVITLAALMLRSRRGEYGDKLDESVNRLLAIALRDDPESGHRLLTQAEILEIQLKYDESVVVYQNMLKRDDIPVRKRAAAENNLAFLLGLMGKQLDEAEILVDKAIQFYGPIADLLDTRGVIRTANKKYDLAIEDLALAITVDHRPTPLFHLARAFWLSGDEKTALKHWKEVQRLGLDRKSLSPLEQQAYDEFASKMQQL